MQKELIKNQPAFTRNPNNSANQNSNLSLSLSLSLSPFADCSELIRREIIKKCGIQRDRQINTNGKETVKSLLKG
jgi:hypothetical protein